MLLAVSIPCDPSTRHLEGQRSSGYKWETHMIKALPVSKSLFFSTGSDVIPQARHIHNDVLPVNAQRLNFRFLNSQSASTINKNNLTHVNSQIAFH